MMSECVCKAGYHGNGISCESLSDVEDHDQRTKAPEGSIGKVCRAHEECSEHGTCSYSRTLGYYHCICKEPYVGNGVECSLQQGTDRREEQQGCDILRDCDQNAQCVYDSSNRIYRCECYQGYAGDGKICVQIHSGTPQQGGVGM
ncbi:EGF-like domain protein [Ancylostoma caninum]|uniref:EGF-like domain protein n=1 Tax=Ancylostoma caninum TaxID=29170 RepID=A0A368FH36_ANCCA|nr:EGF-like domain protein [Ancylostoma caninum]